MQAPTNPNVIMVGHPIKQKNDCTNKTKWYIVTNPQESSNAASAGQPSFAKTSTSTSVDMDCGARAERAFRTKSVPPATCPKRSQETIEPLQL